MKVTLEAARVNSGMTQEKAASLLGISRRSLQKYESYEMSPRVDSISTSCYWKNY